MTAYVYFISAPSVGMVKIGWTRTIDARLRSLRAQSPVALELAALLEFQRWDECEHHEAKAVEQKLHLRHDANRTHGEWFRVSNLIQSDIADIKAGSFDTEALKWCEPPAGGYREKWLAKRAAAIRAGKAAAREVVA